MKHTIWDDEKDAILTEQAGKEPAKAIAARIGMTVEQVYRRADKLALTLKGHGARSGRARYTQEQRDHVAQLKASGKSASNIAEQTGIPLGTIQAWLYLKPKAPHAEPTAHP